MMMKNVCVLVGSLALLAGCSEAIRPSMSTPGSTLTPTNAPMVNVPVMMPAPAKPKMGSLWVPGNKQFFKDSRAHSVGDVLTILVTEKSDAAVAGKTDGSSDYEATSSLTNLLNLEGKLRERGIPLTAANLLSTDSKRDFQGDAKTNRSDSLNATIAAVVVQVLPNGLLVIQGQREVLVNYEKQVLTISGMVRPEDIGAQNTIASSKIAEARIAYAGSGIVDQEQTPKYGVRFLDKVLPF